MCCQGLRVQSNETDTTHPDIGNSLDNLNRPRQSRPFLPNNKVTDLPLVQHVILVDEALGVGTGSGDAHDAVLAHDLLDLQGKTNCEYFQFHRCNTQIFFHPVGFIEVKTVKSIHMKRNAYQASSFVVEATQKLLSCPTHVFGFPKAWNRERLEEVSTTEKLQLERPALVHVQVWHVLCVRRNTVVNVV